MHPIGEGRLVGGNRTGGVLQKETGFVFEQNDATQDGGKVAVGLVARELPDLACGPNCGESGFGTGARRR